MFEQPKCTYADKANDFDDAALCKIVFNPSQHRLARKDEIFEKLADFQTIMPHAVTYKLTKNNRKKLFLDIKYIDDFLAKYNFVKPAPKGQNDFNTVELFTRYGGRQSSYLHTLEEMKKNLLTANDEKSKYIEYKKSPTDGKIELCLNEKLLTEFENMYGSKIKRYIKKSPKNFISSRTLAGKHLDAGATETNKNLDTIYENQDDELNKFTLKIKKVLFLERSHIQDFCARFGYTEKHSDTIHHGPRPSHSKKCWKTADELKHFISYDEDLPFEEMLDKFRFHCPSAIRTNRTWDSYSINLNFLDAFCKYFSLTKDPIPKKKEEWKNAKELSTKYIESSQHEILTKMNELFLAMPDLLQVRKNYDTNQDDICLNIKHISDFCREAKLEMFNEEKIKRTKTLTDYNREDFFNSEQLSKVFNMGSIKRIRDKLLEVQDKLPKNAIVNLVFRRPCVCIHKDYILDFCNMEPLLPQYPDKQQEVLEAVTKFDAEKNKLIAPTENQR